MGNGQGSREDNSGLEMFYLELSRITHNKRGLLESLGVWK